MLGQVRAFDAFIGEEQVLASEEIVSHPSLGYSGVIDLRCERGVLDIKGKTRKRWHGIQAQAYSGCVCAPAWNLYLGDETYELIRRDDPADWACFKAALELYHWQTKTWPKVPA